MSYTENSEFKDYVKFQKCLPKVKITLLENKCIHSNLKMHSTIILSFLLINLPLACLWSLCKVLLKLKTKLKTIGYDLLAKRMTCMYMYGIFSL